MRIFVFLILNCFIFSVSFADEFNISTQNKKNGQTTFYLKSQTFQQEKQAEYFQKKLQIDINVPVFLKKNDKENQYYVMVGPIQNYQSTRELKEQLNSNPNYSREKILVKKSQSSKHIWNLRNADIRAVIAEVSRVTGKNFIIDPRVQGKISIISSNPISSKELYQVFLSMLQVSGYTAVASGSATKIVPNIDAKTQASDVLNRLKSPPNGDEMVVEVIPVKYVPSEQLVPVLRPLMPQWSHVSAYAPSNMLILSGRANNIKRLSHIIKQVDSSNANGIDIVPLKYALAMDIANTLKDMVKNQTSGSMRNKTMLAADDRSNSILISGNKTERIRLRIIISQLDQQGRFGNDSNTKVIYLNYLRAEDIAPILAGVAHANFSGNVGTTIGTITQPALDSTNPASNFASGTSSSPNDSGSDQSIQQSTGNESAASTTASSTESEGSTKPSVQIIAEPNTNSIIINAPASIIRILQSVISQLDIRPAQLLIEALVAEIDQDDVQNLGIEWGTNQQTGNPFRFRPGFAILNSNTDLDDFQAQIYALARERKANILSTPSVVVLDNRQAKILVGRQVSIATTTYPNNAGGTTTASPYTTFDRVNVALHLYVRPQITRANGIKMQIDQGNDTLDRSRKGLIDDQPVFKISSIVTSVHIESGDIVVLGGLTQDSLANNDNRLPILGDIPGIGKLFQRNEVNREKRVLMVFIKPTILRNKNDALHITNSKYNDVRNEQLEFIREQQYNPENNDSLLPPLKEAILPTPFSRPYKKEVIVKKSKKTDLPRWTK